MEHENAVDYEGHGFLRRSGLADIDPIEGHIGTDTPAEPTHERYILSRGLCPQNQFCIF